MADTVSVGNVNVSVADSVDVGKVIVSVPDSDAGQVCVFTSPAVPRLLK